jgi:pyruvate ferredoxin oxidoreductase beta subunit
MSYGLARMNSIRKPLTIGGPTFIHSPDPCPKGWDYDPYVSHEMGELAVTTGIWPLYEVENGVLKLIGKTQQIANGKIPRLPVRDYLLKRDRFAHFTNDDIDYFQNKVDEIWTKWLIPGVIPSSKEQEASHAPN